MLLLSVLFGASLFASELEPLDDLTQLQWSHRLLVIKGSGDELSLLAKNHASIEERDIIWFVVDAEQVHSNAFRPVSSAFKRRLQNYDFKPGEHAVLIGKDGGVKQRQADLNLNDVFALIDTMPMRRMEMRQ